MAAGAAPLDGRQVLTEGMGALVLAQGPMAAVAAGPQVRTVRAGLG